jgi:hypothetical protein
MAIQTVKFVLFRGQSSLLNEDQKALEAKKLQRGMLKYVLGCVGLWAIAVLLVRF